MSDVNATFARILLSDVHATAKAVFPQIDNVMRAAGVVRHRRGEYFVQIDVRGFERFSHNCRAYNATEARAKAWQAFIRKHGEIVEESA